jgi:hypothetical protein
VILAVCGRKLFKHFLDIALNICTALKHGVNERRFVCRYVGRGGTGLANVGIARTTLLKYATMRVCRDSLRTPQRGVPTTLLT